MLDARVDEHESVTFGLEGEILELTAPAVETHQLACLSEDGSELVHDAAVAAYVLMLGSLSGKHHIPFGDCTVEQVVQTESEATLERC